jgi:amino acid transporter
MNELGSPAYMYSVGSKAVTSQSGGVYFWAAQLLSNTSTYDPGWAAFWAWETAWLNLLGQIGTTAGVDFGLARVVGAFMHIATGSRFDPSPSALIGIYAVVLILHALINTMSVKHMGMLGEVSVWWHIIGTVVIIAVVLASAPTLQPASFVFGKYHNETGWTNDAYVALLGLLMAQFTMTGYDASAHVSEETKNAAIAAPAGILMAIVVSFLVGWALLISITFGIQDYEGALNSSTGLAIAQIFLDCCGPVGACLLLVIVIGAIFFAGMSSLTCNARMVFAFARDGGLPFSHTLSRVSASKTPVYGGEA